MENNTEKIEIKQQQKDLLHLILKKTGIPYNVLIEHAKRDFILNNLDVLTVSEKKQFTKRIL
jgi:predicted phage-related endonuclease